MGPNIPWDLFKKLFNKELSGFDSVILEQWRAKSELNHHIYDEILADQNFQEIIVSGKWENSSQEWQKLLSKIKPSKSQLTIPRKTLYWMSGAAAAILLFIGLSFGLFYERSNQNKSLAEAGYTHIFSPRGQRTSVILPDNTKVWLNSETSLRYSVTYNRKIREVFLEGEAFFDVSKNPDVPFLVNAGEIKVKVYGTSFNIKAFPEERFIETTLIEGKLSVVPTNIDGKQKEEIYLSPNEKCIYEKIKYEPKIGKKPDALANNKPQKIEASHIVLSKDVNTESEKQWKDGKLIFKNESFDELAVKLERWFDVKIHFEDQRIKEYKFTGAFDKETINQAMEALRLSSQRSYQYNILFRDIYLK